MASRMVCNGLMTRRPTIIMAPNVRRQPSPISELQHQRAQGRGMLRGTMFLGRFKRGFSDLDRRAHARHG